MHLKNKKILLIEDSPETIELIKSALQFHPVELVVKTDGQKGLKAALMGSFDLILMEILLPRWDGWELCRRIKAAGVETPIIIISQIDNETDKVLGLELGADDYITKPFSPKELLARMQAILRPFHISTNSEKNKLMIEEIGLKIDIENYSVYLGRKPLRLTPKEFEILAYLCKHPKEIITREKFINQLWEGHAPSHRAVDEHIKSIRKKLVEAGLNGRFLEAIRGKGYRFNPQRAVFKDK